MSDENEVERDCSLKITAVELKREVVDNAAYFLWISTASRLNVPKILLPYYHGERPINFTLEAQDGCYSWRSERPEIASVQAIPDDTGKACSNRATVTALSTHPTRLNTKVFAEEQGTGHILRCDVIVDVIFSIDIVTITQVLYLDDSPEQFEVRAKDDEGNTFSSLEGLQFEWTLISETESGRIIDANTILRILPFEPTQYTPPPYIAEMEKKGQQGDIILIEGLKTGSAKVSTKLKAFGFREVKPSIVRVIVIDNLALNPPYDVYLLVHAHIKYKVGKLRQGKYTLVTLPSSQYWLEIKDSRFASLDTATCTVTGITQGDTEIILKDKNVKEELSQPTAGIHVVEPSYLGFVVLPGRNWVLETSRKYEIIIEIYDKDSHKIHASENIRIDVNFHQDYFKVLYSSLNGSYHIVETLQHGVTEIEASLISVMLPNGNVEKLPVPVSDKQEAEIFDPIIVTPKIVTFPWQPSQRAPYQYTMLATGGSGNYTWTSSKKEIVSVNVHGMVTTTGGVGQSIITASDIRNVAHYGTAKVSVIPPGEMEFLPAKVEAEIGTTLDLPLIVSATLKTTGEKIIMTDCRHAKFSVSIGDISVFQQLHDDIDPPEGSCAVLRVKALIAGNTQVNAIYLEGDSKLQASITIAAYPPLKPLDPEELAVVALGSSKTLVLTGGPQPWILDPSKYYQTIEAKDKLWLKLSHLRGLGATKNYHLFDAVCLDFGEQELKVTVGNQPSSKNPFPAVTEAFLRIACAKPTSLHLVPVIKYPNLDTPCPITADSHNQIPVRYSDNLEILVYVADKNGHNFDNFTSLTITWDSSDKYLATFVNHVTTLTDVDGDYPGSKKLKAFQTTVLMSQLGLVSVTASIRGYDTKLLKAQQISQSPNISPVISTSLELLLVNSAVITPDTVSVFNHPSSKVSLTVKGGSGHYWVQTSDRNLAKVSYQDKKKQIEVIPQLDGSLVITTYDLCLDSPTHATANVYISGVNLIEVRVVDKVEIGHDIQAKVRVLDSSGKPLHRSYFMLMGLKPYPASMIISVREKSECGNDEYTACYVIHGAALGRTTLSFIANAKSGHIVSSQAREIQVFPSLRLDPRNVTLIIGAVFQVRSHGGPQPQAHIQYSIGDDQIATINGSGLINAVALGHTKVIGTAQAFDTETGETVTYSQDSIDVYVVRLTGVNIYAPSSMLETGAEMPVYAMGINEFQTPFSFGHAIPGLRFYWTVSNIDVVTLSSVYYKSCGHTYSIGSMGYPCLIGINSENENNFGMRLHAVNPGQATLQLKVTISKPGHNQIINDIVLTEEVQIEVFAKLSLVNPDTCHSVLLMSPNTHTSLKTNRDGAAQMTYSIQNGGGISKAVVDVDAMGHVKSSALSGHSSILVTSHEEFGINQTLVILVKVKPVSYLSINCESTVTTTGQKLFSFPVGIALSFIISFHDDVGEKFHATNTELIFRINRFDLLQVNQGLQNGTFVARATSIGNTIFKVWDKNNPRIADYINVPVDRVIGSGNSDIVMADIICFSSPLRAKDGRRGSWISQDSSVLSIDRQAGIAVAKRPGTTTIYQNISENFVTHTEITVHPIRHVYIDSNTIAYVSNLVRSSSYSFPVLLGSTSHVKGENCSEELATVYNKLVLHSVPFRCNMAFQDKHIEIKAHDLFQVYADFDVDTGQYLCIVSQLESGYSAQLLSTINTNLQLSVTVLRQEHQQEVQSSVLSLPFIPGFHVSQSEISLSNAHPNGELLIQGVKKVRDTVRVMSSDVSIVELGSVQEGQISQRYTVSLTDTTRLLQEDNVQVYIEITSTMTGQDLKVPVNIHYVDMKGKPVEPVKLSNSARIIRFMSDNYQSWLYHILLVLATIGLLFIGYHIFIVPRYYRGHARPDVFLAPGQGSPPPQYTAQTPVQQGYSPGRNQSLNTSSPYQNTSPYRRSATKLWSTGQDQY
ncbi:nuclear pore membrane glycoprotein 210-like [Glandiceps talaboti]